MVSNMKTIHIELSRTYCSLCVLGCVKLDDTSSTGAAVGLVLDLSFLHWTNGGKKVDKVLITSRPWKVADVDDWASFATVSRMIGEWVGSLWDEGSRVHAARSTASIGASSTTVSSTKASATTAEAATTTAEAAAESSTTSESSSETTASTTKATASTAWWSIGKSVFANFECTSLPFISVELADGATCIVGVVEDDDTRALGATIGSEMNVSAYDVSDLSCETMM